MFENCKWFPALGWVGHSHRSKLRCFSGKILHFKSVPGAGDQCMSFYCKCYPLYLRILPRDLGATCSLLAALVSPSIILVLPEKKQKQNKIEVLDKKSLVSKWKRLLDLKLTCKISTKNFTLKKIRSLIWMNKIKGI
jgi:hypothetical protein